MTDFSSQCFVSRKIIDPQDISNFTFRCVMNAKDQIEKRPLLMNFWMNWPKDLFVVVFNRFTRQK